MEYLNYLSRSRHYLLGISGGCDSMALLAMTVREKLNIAVCFVNYKLRKSADIEEKLVRDYCQQYQVPLYVLYPVQKEKDNFQKWARDVRYEFYKQVYDELGCDALLLGHQKDDHLENYLMARERNSHGWFYGIQRESFHHGMHIIRPLLGMRKQETRQYCLDNGVPFHDDESNFTDKYTRNRIRHQMIEAADEAQIQRWIEEIDEFNEKQLVKLEGFANRYDRDIPITDFENETDKNDLIRWLICHHDREGSYSDVFIEDIIKGIENASHGHKELHDGYKLAWEYGVIYVWKPEGPFEVVLDDIVYGDYSTFSLRSHGRKIEGLHLNESDFPIRIRNYHEGDVIEMRYGHKKVNRFFIDRKILTRERQKWLVVQNRDEEIIFVEGIGCDVRHYDRQFNLYIVKQQINMSE